MKKLTYAIALCTLLLAGCSQDEAIVENKGELVTLNYNVSLGDGVQSRAGETPDLEVNKLLCAVYQTSGENPGFKYSQTVDVENGTAKFAPTLSDELNYKVVFWAYYAETDGETCYNLADLECITINDNYDTGVFAYDSYKDAFTSTDIIESGNSEKSGNVTLKRPFGKVSVLTSVEDYEDAVELKGAPIGSTLTITGYSDVYNALDEEWKGTGNITLNSEVSTTVKEIDGVDYYYLADEYLFAGAGNVACQVVVNGSGFPLYSKNIPNVPVGANASTNLYNENLLTGGGVIYNISIETGFSNNDEKNQGIDGAETGNQNGQEGEEGNQAGTENQ